MKIGIVGAGIAGLASAIRLASKGHEVTVFEANDYIGGKLSQFTLAEGKYRFDAGPSLFTMPQYVEELFAAANETTADHFRYERLPIICEYFWDNGTRLTAFAEKERFAEEVEEKLGVKKAITLKMLSDSERKYKVTGRIFLEKSLHLASTWLNKEVAKAMLQIPTLDIFSSMHHTHQRLLKNPQLVQLFDRYATYNGSNPYKASGILSIIPHFEYGFGAFYPRGGMFQISNSLYELAKRKSVVFHLGQKVNRILTQNDAAVGLEVGSEQHFFDRIITNADVHSTYRQLLPDAPQPERLLRQPKSTSALIFYWGIAQTFKELDLHNIFFSNDYKSEFEALAAKKVADDVTVYVNITSKLSPEDAPEGHENWFVMVNVPHDSGTEDWAEIITRTRENIIRRVSHCLKTDLKPLIVAEQILTPTLIHSKTSSFGGALYGNSSNNMMAAFLRHANFSQRIPHLYFVGGSVHPGGGIPLCLLSAKIMSEVMK